MFQRNASTGVLSSAATVQLTSMTDTVMGTIAGMVSSSHNSTDKLFVSMSTSPDEGGLMVLDVVCGPIVPAASPAPGEVYAELASRSNGANVRWYLWCQGRHVGPVSASKLSKTNLQNSMPALAYT